MLCRYPNTWLYAGIELTANLNIAWSRVPFQIEIAEYVFVYWHLSERLMWVSYISQYLSCCDRCNLYDRAKEVPNISSGVVALKGELKYIKNYCSTLWQDIFIRETNFTIYWNPSDKDETGYEKAARTWTEYEPITRDVLKTLNVPEIISDPWGPFY